MPKQELTTLLRSVGGNENTITAMENAYDMGVEYGRSEFTRLAGYFMDEEGNQVLGPVYTRQGDEA